jgi:hypothetical protein
MADHANAATDLPTEEVQLWFGPVTRLVGRGDSAVLAQLPVGVYPDPEPGCASCPAKDWYLTRKGLRCFCTSKNVIAWVSNDDPVLVCDARERLIVEEAEDGIDGRASTPGGWA